MKLFIVGVGMVSASGIKPEIAIKAAGYSFAQTNLHTFVILMSPEWDYSRISSGCRQVISSIPMWIAQTSADNYPNGTGIFLNFEVELSSATGIKPGIAHKAVEYTTGQIWPTTFVIVGSSKVGWNWRSSDDLIMRK